jgi:hypothetical protein
MVLLHQCEFEEYLDNDVPPNYQGRWNTIDNEVKYNMHLEKHRRQMRQYVLTVQQLLEQEIGVKLSEDELMMHHVIRGAMAQRGSGQRDRGRRLRFRVSKSLLDVHNN